MELTKRKVTLYLTDENWFFGNVNKIEATAYGVRTGKYAQYTEAVFILFVPKGKRNSRGLVQASHPNVLILDGWGHPDPDPMMVKGEMPGTQESKYTGWDPRWESDFDARINPYIKESGVQVLADHRKADRRGL
jgi:hypothetical protein